MTTCAYVTFDDRDEHDDERGPALEAWHAVGIEGRTERWDDPEADWSAYDAVVVRSAWDYLDRRAEFLAWTRQVESVTRLLNPAAVIEANTDKTYLRDLGVPTVPTHWSSRELPRWDEYVVKPAISAGARDTIRTTDRGRAQAHAAALESTGRTPMVQPYLDMVESEGETSLLYFNRRFSHAVRRTPMLVPGMTGADNPRAQSRTPAPDQVELAEKVLAAIPQALLYARIDLVRLHDGSPAVIEVELSEPYLYLRYEPTAAANLATALRELVEPISR
ncbi:ATP-grasp domain-containing protein [Nonomuraea sp. LPB2021202275-12-8]|uniref:ATP-grasp domain-containing protein n=1 Tax=Nonomuraea sp. LPB2021202275-12-8 TaxID=3120159 RepID=UPI00300CA2ED